MIDGEFNALNLEINILFSEFFNNLPFGIFWVDFWIPGQKKLLR